MHRSVRMPAEPISIHVSCALFVRDYGQMIWGLRYRCKFCHSSDLVSPQKWEWLLFATQPWGALHKCMFRLFNVKRRQGPVQSEQVLSSYKSLTGQDLTRSPFTAPRAAVGAVQTSYCQKSKAKLYGWVSAFDIHMFIKWQILSIIV